MSEDEFLTQARLHKAMFIDAPARKVAIYHGGTGTMVIGVKEDDYFAICCISPDEIPEFIQRVTEIGFECVAEWARFCADIPKEDR